MVHECSEKVRLERLERHLEGNGKGGLISDVSSLTAKVDLISGIVKEVNNKVGLLTEFMHKANSAKATKEMLLTEERLKLQAEIDRRRNLIINIRWAIALIITTGIAVWGFIT